MTPNPSDDFVKGIANPVTEPGTVELYEEPRINPHPRPNITDEQLSAALFWAQTELWQEFCELMDTPGHPLEYGTEQHTGARSALLELLTLANKVVGSCKLLNAPCTCDYKGCRNVP